MKILITGHEGFVGRHFVKKLKDHEITGLDIKSGNDCRDFFKKDNTKFDLVIHLAAIVGGRSTIEGNPIAVATDLSIDAEMFNWAVRTNPSHVVYYSSSAAYPIELQNKLENNNPAPYFLKESDIDLDNIKNPDMTYGWAKLTGEMLAKFAREKHGLNVHVFRPFSGYGTDQDLDYPFPSFIKRAKDGLDPFPIWSDGLQVRDWIHIDDIVEATLKAVELNITQPINLGTARPINFIELAYLITDLAGYTPEFECQVDKPRGVGFRCSNNSLMTSFYEPKISLEEGIWKALN